jgi:3-dehydroquinate dehydratase-2
MRIGVLHGPNLDLLGTRQPELYGATTLAEIDARLAELGETLGVTLASVQSNHEGELVDWVRDRAGEVAGYVVNAAAFTHTSMALLDGLLAVDRPFVEVHLTNLAARSRRRRRSLLAAHAAGVIMGFGARSYARGHRALVEHVRDSTGTGGGPTGSARGG